MGIQRRVLNALLGLWAALGAIGTQPTMNQEQLKRLHLTNQLAGFTATLTVLYFGLFLSLGLGAPAVIMLLALANYLLVLWLNHQGRRRVATPLLLVNGNLQVASVAYMLGDEAGIHLFLVAAAMSPFLYYSREALRLALFFAGFSLLLYLGLEVAFALGQAPILISDDLAQFCARSTFVANLIAVVAFTFYMFEENQRVESALDKERDHAERLLLNILPAPVAERLKQGHKRIADHHDDVTVLFADVVGFTALSRRLPPAATVALLDQIFCAFDGMVGRRGLEKIRTIGDGYYVAGGVPEARADHAQAVALLALEMRDHLMHCELPREARALQIRIGINSGSVLAGVIGERKFQYDLWGDDVNLAARMESQGLPGKIQLSAATAALLGDEFVCVQRGSVDIKGVGPMPTWILEGRAFSQ